MTIRRRLRCKAPVLGLALGVALLGGAATAVAEDTGFWEIVRSMQPSSRPFGAMSGFRVVAPPPSTAPAIQIVRPSVPAAPPKPVVFPDASKRENPLAALLNDSTLRHGDVVMFPDGPRVFRGASGGRHRVEDFVRVARSGDVASASRKTLLAMRPGENDAWSADVVTGRGQMARRIADVESTGSIAITSIGKTVTVRTGRGDVRVIRVPD
jgi:hypothetical protein